MTKNLLDLDDKELDAELQKIIKESKPTRILWTAREEKILETLRAKNIPYRVILTYLPNRTLYSIQRHAELIKAD